MKILNCIELLNEPPNYLETANKVLGNGGTASSVRSAFIHRRSWSDGQQGLGTGDIFGGDGATGAGWLSGSIRNGDFGSHRGEGGSCRRHVLHNYGFDYSLHFLRKEGALSDF